VQRASYRIMIIQMPQRPTIGWFSRIVVSRSRASGNPKIFQRGSVSSRGSTGALTLVFVLSAAVLVSAEPPGDYRPILNEGVRVLHVERMIYPLAARIAHIEGAVVLEATINSQGRVTGAVALSGPKALLGDTVENLRKWTFSAPRSSKAVVVYWFRIQRLCELPSPADLNSIHPTLLWS
jgi:TonB family protein